MIKVETGGIPWDKIRKKVQDGTEIGIVYGDSGRPLKYEIHDSKDSYGKNKLVWVADAYNNMFHMAAYVYPAKGTLRLNLHTRDFKGDHDLRHPDMRARQFIGDALGLFEEFWDITPTHFISRWTEEHGYSTNLELFNESYMTTRDPLQAATQTWVGKVLMEDYAFSSPVSVYVDIGKKSRIPEEVIATFPRKTCFTLLPADHPGRRTTK